jgi:O-antigen ligase
MHDHWWFGRGFGTFLPLSYFYLDNQYLMSMLNGGLLGLVILIALYVVAMSTARGARKRTEERVQRDLAQAVAASIAAFALTALTFDQFSFDQCGFTLFVLIGCAGALWTASRRRVTTAPEESGRAISLAVR